MKKLEPKKPRALNPQPEVKKRPSKPSKSSGLSKSDPDFYKKIGLLSVKRRKLSSEDYAEMARASHPRPGGYHGGRPKKIQDDGE